MKASSFSLLGRSIIAGVFTVTQVYAQSEAPYLYGIHDHDPQPTEYLSHISSGAGGGWVTATVAVGANPNDFGGANFSSIANSGHTVICRINYGYFPDGTIPVSSQYDNFATRCKNFVQNSQGCTIWLIANETNLPGEWPLNQSSAAVTPQDYATCFRKVYNAIKSVRPNDKVICQALAPWAGPYGAGNVNGYPHQANSLNWVQYMNQMLTAIKNSGGIDGIALHINSRGYTYNDIHSTAKVNAGGQNLYWSFYVYKDWVDYGIPTNMWNLPLYATECNGYYYWKGNHPENPAAHYEAGWMQEVYAEINRYNQTAYQTGRPVFKCVNMYRWCGFCDGWNIDGSPYKAQILSDLDAAVAQKYTWKANASKAVSITAPSTVTGGQNFSATVKMRNTGTRPWVQTGATPHRLGSQIPQDNTTWGFNRVNLPVAQVNPGQEATFTFTATAPATAGNYTFAWKMVQDAVEWFGDTASKTISVNGSEVIVDNSNSGFSASATWSTGTSAPGKYGSDYRFRNTQAASDAATWVGNLPTSGNYQVHAWWSQGSNRSATAPYIIYHSAGSQTVQKNQQVNGGVWNLLGTWNMNAGNNNVRLSCWTTTGYVVIADAVKWVKQ